MRYGAPINPLDQFRDFVRRGGIPVTNTLLIASVVTFFARFLAPSATNKPIDDFLVFHTNAFFQKPWTLLTYPVVSSDLLTLLIGGFFLWLSGGSLERSWGSPRFAGVFFALSALFALFLTLGVHALHNPALSIGGFNLPLSGVIVAFCALNPEQTVQLYFIPVRAKYIIYIIALFLWVGYGPLLGLFACAGVLATYLYMTYGNQYGGRGYSPRRSDSRILRLDLDPGKKTTRRTSLDGSAPRGALDFAGRWRDYQEKKRLQQLLKNSGFTDSIDWRDDDPKRRR